VLLLREPKAPRSPQRLLVCLGARSRRDALRAALIETRPIAASAYSTLPSLTFWRNISASVVEDRQVE
jgi:hypothetical protein